MSFLAVVLGSIGAGASEVDRLAALLTRILTKPHVPDVI
jgi:hypothetical protein